MPNPYTDPVLEVLDRFTTAIEFAANIDGATATPLMHEEARNLAGVIYDLLTPTRLLETLLDALLALDPSPTDLGAP